ncbi:MAG TPA: glycosyltransferase [Candidatus Saccharimonadales bacterium]|nr:glycosyltransferase [Candidatus Saccharimonadales bacterium]
MAGPGIRYTKVAKTLSRVADVTLAVTNQKNTDDKSVPVVSPENNSYRPFFDGTDIIFAQWLSNEMLAYAASKGKAVIFDLYAPVPIEFLAHLEFSKSDPDPKKNVEFGNIIEMYRHYFNLGSYFVCSNERQKDFWMGFLTAQKIIGPDTFTKRSFGERFLIGPMGIDKTPPKPKRLLLRSRLGLSKDDFILLWTGGIWDWFDAQLVVKAMSKVNNPKVKLVFLGTKHPNTDVYQEEMGESLQARKLSEKLGLLDKSVFFLDGWVPYEERLSYLADADAAIYADKDSLETRYSHRSRVLDHIWAGLPTICSRGDYLSEVIESKGLGIVVNRSVAEFAGAINELAKPAVYKNCVANLKKAMSQFTWEQTLLPLCDVVSSMDLSFLAHQAKTQSKKYSGTKRLPIKSRVKQSARIMLLGR